MAKHRSIVIKRKVDIVVFVAGWLGMVINSVSNNPILNMFPIIKIRRTLLPSALAASFPGPVLGMSTNIQLIAELGYVELGHVEFGQKLGNEKSSSWWLTWIRCCFIMLR